MTNSDSPLRTASFAAPALAANTTDWGSHTPEEWSTNPPTKEKGIEDYFDSLASPRFTLYKQIWLRHPNGGRFRIDRIGVEKSGCPKGIIGFEFKSGNVMTESFTDFSKAIAQGIDYSHCRIESDFVAGQDWFGCQLRYVFLFPCLYSIYEIDNIGYDINQPPVLTARDLWAQGELKIASKYGVGAISYIRRKRDWAFLLGGHPAYWMSTGATDLAVKHSQGERAGSGR